MEDPVGPTDWEDENATAIHVPAWRPTPRPHRDRTTIGLLALSALLLVASAVRGRATRWEGIAPLAAAVAGVVTAAATILVRGLPLAQLRYPIPELNEPPQQEDPVEVPGHGTLRRGRTELPLKDDSTRPFLWLWLDHAADNECGPGGTYRWYQFVRPRFFVNGDEKRLSRDIEGATGRRYDFGEWNPDYHVKEVKPHEPDFNPDGLEPTEPGKPLKQYPIPGTTTPDPLTRRRLTGVLDAPDFCTRKRNRPAPIERLLRRTIRPPVVESPNRPDEREVTVEVRIEARSYLVCIRDDQVECIGYVSWEYTNEARIRVVWQQRGTVLGTNRRWEPATELLSCERRLTIGGWSMPC